MTRRNLATDPRGSGSAEWDLEGFTEAPGDPLAGFSTSRRFTAEPIPQQPIDLVNLAHVRDCYVSTTTGTITKSVAGSALRVTYTKAGNSGWSDALVVRPIQAASSGTKTPVQPGQLLTLQYRWRANRPRSARWRLSPYDASGTSSGTVNLPYETVYAGPDDFALSTFTQWEVPDGVVDLIVTIGSGRPSNGDPIGFQEGEWMEFRDVMITVDQPFESGYAFDGSTPDTMPTDDAAGADYGWSGAVDASSSTRIPRPPHTLGLDVPDLTGPGAVIRLEVRASEPIPGGRLVLTGGDAEQELLGALDLPAGSSSIVAAGDATDAAGIALVWGTVPDGAELEATGVLIEPTDTANPDPAEHRYFDGWTLDVPATGTAEGVEYSWEGVPQASPSQAVPTPVVKSEIRQAFADALSTVPGITGYPQPPRTLGRGQGWPVWQSRSPLTLAGDELRWLVHVTLPPGLTEATVLEAEEITEYVLEALSHVGVIEQIQPDALATVQDGGAQPVPALTVTMTTTT